MFSDHDDNDFKENIFWVASVSISTELYHKFHILESNIISFGKDPTSSYYLLDYEWMYVKFRNEIKFFTEITSAHITKT